MVIRTLIPGAWIEESETPPVEIKDYTKVTFYNGKDSSKYSNTFYVAADSSDDPEANTVEPKTINSQDISQLITSEDDLTNVIYPSNQVFNEAQVDTFYFFSLTPLDIKQTTLFLLNYKCNAIVESDCYIKLIPEKLVAEKVNGEEENNKAKQIFEIAKEKPNVGDDGSTSAQYEFINLYGVYCNSFITQNFSCDNLNSYQKCYPVLVLKTGWEQFKFYDFSMIQ